MCISLVNMNISDNECGTLHVPIYHAILITLSTPRGFGSVPNNIFSEKFHEMAFICGCLQNYSECQVGGNQDCFKG